MGPNGSGKSTLSYVLSGKDKYEIDEGTIEYNEKNLLELDVDERANEGLFLAFQYPMEIPGVQTSFFLKTAINSKRKYLGHSEMDALEFAKLMKSKAEELNINTEMLKRDLNVNYSGGEKKKQEILQMSMLSPKMAILDETDSGLDIDALRIVSEGVNKLRSKENSFLVITHYQRLLNYIKPDFVHIIADGRIVKSGDYSLALELEEKGYEEISKSA
jgi:Fe-S cluster assembly ATP-binding protein